MRALPTIHDRRYTPKVYNRIDYFLLKFIRDERDLPFLHLIFKITFIMIPLGLLLYFPALTGWLWWTVAIAYLYANVVVFKGPFGLMLHCTSHRPLFKNRYQILNKYQPWVVGPFFGQTPETYFSHHIGMHHVENNLPEDDSSTMIYQRDSVRSFLHYLMDFVFLGLDGLVSYLKRKKRNKLAKRALIGELSFFGGCILLSFVNLPATFVVFIFPFLLSRVIMMVGNWTQHAFVDPNDPDNPYTNSITCVNIVYNHRCWNDGYHTSHHIRPTMHWTEHPDSFLSTVDQYAQNRALVFDGLDFGQVFWCLMNKRYNQLAQHVVNINGMFASEEEVINLMRQRTQRVEVTTELTGGYAKKHVAY